MIHLLDFDGIFLVKTLWKKYGVMEKICAVGLKK